MRIKHISAVGGFLMLGLVAWHVEIEYGVLERFKRKEAWPVAIPSPDLIDTPLGRAAFKGDTGELKRLLASGMPVDIRDKGGRTALCIAAGMSQTEGALVLLEHGANPNAPTDGWGPLYGAAEKGDLVLVRALLKRGADPNADDGSGATPIFGAVLNGNEEIVHLLLNSGAVVAVHDRWGETPLSLAQGQLAAARKGGGLEGHRKAHTFERIVMLLKEHSDR